MYVTVIVTFFNSKPIISAIVKFYYVTAEGRYAHIQVYLIQF